VYNGSQSSVASSTTRLNMRHVCLCAVLCALSATIGYTRSSGSPDHARRPILTIVLEFRGPHGARSVEEMEHEVASILRNAGREIEWRSWEQATQGVFDTLAVVRFTGNCGVPPWPHEAASDGPLGFTYISDGAVLPFSEIACEKIARSVGPAILSMEPAQAEAVFGRAMGRVVAHELIHMISGSTNHGREGIARSAFSRSDLTCERLNLGPADLLRVTGKDRR
jgi:hypothetical protein